MAVVTQLRDTDGIGSLGVNDGGAPEMQRSMARLEIQLGLVVAPGTVRCGDNGLPAVLEAQAMQQQGHTLDEVPVRVIVDG